MKSFKEWSIEDVAISEAYHSRSLADQPEEELKHIFGILEKLEPFSSLKTSGFKNNFVLYVRTNFRSIPTSDLHSLFDKVFDEYSTSEAFIEAFLHITKQIDIAELNNYIKDKVDIYSKPISPHQTYCIVLFQDYLGILKDRLNLKGDWNKYSFDYYKEGCLIIYTDKIEVHDYTNMNNKSDELSGLEHLKYKLGIVKLPKYEKVDYYGGYIQPYNKESTDLKTEIVMGDKSELRKRFCSLKDCCKYYLEITQNVLYDDNDKDCYKYQEEMRKKL